MIDKWFNTLKLPLTIQQFHELPRNPAYKYEYITGEAWLTPRPKSYHALLDLRSFDPPVDLHPGDQAVCRRLADEDWEQLPAVLAAAFHDVQPFASVDQNTRLQAAEDCLRETREGTEGPLVEAASFVATCDPDTTLVGAVLITLSPAGDLSDIGALRWKEPPPEDAVSRGMGRPHLTWAFVSPWYARQGLGTALLTETVRELTRLGYGELASTFLLGNELSTLWHWRMGFRVTPYPGSMRTIRERASR